MMLLQYADTWSSMVVEKDWRHNVFELNHGES